MFDWTRALDIGHAQSVLPRVPSGQRCGRRRGQYIPLDCNVVLEAPQSSATVCANNQGPRATAAHRER